MKLGAIHTPAPADLLPLARRVNLAKLYVPICVDWLRHRPADGNALGNDRLGNCVPCAQLRAIELRQAVAWDDTWAPSEAEAVGLYQALTGFDPATGLPDDGTDTGAAMAAWGKTGIRVNNQVLDIVGWAPVDPKDDGAIARALEHFGPCQVTLALPQAAQDTTTWSKAPGDGPSWEPASWGYHRVCLGAAYEAEFIVRSWGRDVGIHPEWWARYAVAVDATLSRDWLNAMGGAPDGLDWDQLAADMQALAVSGAAHGLA
jgi:hypothetical protein